MWRTLDINKNMEITKRIFGSLLLSFIAMACVAQETVKNDEDRKQDGEARLLELICIIYINSHK